MDDQEQLWQPFAASIPDQEPDIFCNDEWEALLALRTSYQRGRDLLTPQEQARLRFICWLIDSGRLDPS